MSHGNAGGDSWALRPRRSPFVGPLAASILLIVVGLVVGGPLGWLGAAFFSVSALTLAVQLVRREPLLVLDTVGATVRGLDADQARRIGWDDIEGIILWTQQPAGGGRIELLSIVTPSTLTANEGGELAMSWTDHLVAQSVVLDDCRVDADELTAVVGDLGSLSEVIDRRES